MAVAQLTAASLQERVNIEQEVVLNHFIIKHNHCYPLKLSQVLIA